MQREECGEQRGRRTYHDGHAQTLHKGGEEEQGGGDLPSGGAPLYSTGEHDDEGNQGAKLDGDVEGDQEAGGPPHVAKGFILLTIRFLRERDVGVVRTPVVHVQAHGEFATVILGPSAERRKRKEV